MPSITRKIVRGKNQNYIVYFNNEKPIGFIFDGYLALTCSLTSDSLPGNQQRVRDQCIAKAKAKDGIAHPIRLIGELALSDDAVRPLKLCMSYTALPENAVAKITEMSKITDIREAFTRCFLNEEVLVDASSEGHFVFAGEADDRYIGWFAENQPAYHPDNQPSYPTLQ